jgi:hypothetical protein
MNILHQTCTISGTATQEQLTKLLPVLRKALKWNGHLPVTEILLTPGPTNHIARISARKL